MNESSTPVTGAAPAPRSFAQRIAHYTLVGIFGLALGCLGALALIGAMPVLRSWSIFKEDSTPSGAVLILLLLLALVLPGVIVARLMNRGILRGLRLAVLAVLIVAAFGYLAWDARTVEHLLTIEELAPAVSGDDASYRVLLRFAKDSPAAAGLKPVTFEGGAALSAMDKDPQAWIKFVHEHRAEIEAGWASLAPIRSWWDELAAYDRIGDLSPATVDAPIMAFQPVRSYTQHAVAIATLQALDGHGDEALTTLTRLYEVARKLEANSRSLVRLMIAKVSEKNALEGAAFVLDHTTVSAAARSAFASSLRSTNAGAPGARRLVLLEYAFFQANLSSIVSGAAMGEAPARRVLRALSPILVNPRATANLVGERYYALASLAEQRKLNDFNANMAGIERDFVRNYHVKNLGGRYLAEMAMPAFPKVVQVYWETEDLRATVLNRLGA